MKKRSVFSIVLLTVIMSLPVTAQKGTDNNPESQELPGAQAPRLETLASPPNGIVVSELVVAEILKELDSSRPLPQTFPSGLGKLQLRLVLTYRGVPPASIRFSIETRSGPLQVAGYRSVIRKTGELTLKQDLEAPSGLFADGPYRLRLMIDEQPVAQLNWTMGGAAPTTSGAAAMAAPPGVLTRAHSDRVTQLAITPDQSTLVSSAWDKTVKVWSMANQKPIKTLKIPSGNVYCLAISPDGKTLVTGSHNDAIRLWSLPSAEPSGELEAEDGSATAMAISPDGGVLVVGYGTATIKLWSLPERRVLAKLRAGSGVESLAVTPDSKILVAGSFGSIELWSLPEAKPIGKLATPKYLVNGLAITPDGSILASASESEPAIRLWSLPTGRPITVLEGHKEGVNALAITPDGALLLSGSADNTIGVWSLAERKLSTVLTGHTADIFSLAITPDGNTLAAGDESGSVNLWDLKSRSLRGSLRGDAYEDDDVSSLLFAPSEAGVGTVGPSKASPANGLQKYSDATNRLSFSYPAAWKQITPAEANRVMGASPSKYLTAVLYDPKDWTQNVNVQVLSPVAAQNLTKEAYGEFLKELDRDFSGRPGFRKVSASVGPLSDMAALQYVNEWTRPDGVRLRQKQLRTGKGGREIAITFTSRADRYEEVDKACFNIILETLKLE